MAFTFCKGRLPNRSRPLLVANTGLNGLNWTIEHFVPTLTKKLFARTSVLTRQTFHALFHFIQNLFRTKAAAPADWHAVKLSPAQVRRHTHWVEQRVFLNWLGPYFKAYHLHKGGAASTRGLKVQPLYENGCEGVLLFFDPTIGPGNFRHLYEHLGERLLALGYHRACADQRVDKHEHLTETKFKQLFKPNPTNCPETGHCDQRYGLVTVDLLAMNGNPIFIRLTSNAVLDPNFTTASSFHELLKSLLDAPPADAVTKDLLAEYHAKF